MNFGLSEEQELLREAARDALGRIDTVAGARQALEGAQAPDTWSLAAEAGWAGLLVGEDHGGAGLGVFDAMLVHEELGRRLAGTGLLGHLAATGVLDSAAEDTEVAALLPALAAGDQRAALTFARPPSGAEPWTVDAAVPGRGRAPLPHVFPDGAVTGEIALHPDLPGADVFVVAASGDDGEVVPVLVEAGAPGAELAVEVHGDATRPLGTLTLREAAARRLPADELDLARAWHTGQALLAAEALGVCQAVLDMAVAYAKERHAFGRPIGSYQAVKHQLVEILRRIDLTRNLCFFAGYAAGALPEELALAASAARFAGEEGADYATRTCIAVHGGIGATWEHDAPLFWRRAQLSRRLLGGVQDAGDRVAGEIITAARDRVAAAA